jgi:hypothetical protein
MLVTTRECFASHIQLLACLTSNYFSILGARPNDVTIYRMVVEGDAKTAEGAC